MVIKCSSFRPVARPSRGGSPHQFKSAFQFECGGALPEGRVFHGGDVYTTPPVKTPGLCVARRLSARGHFRRGDVFASENGDDGGALQAAEEGETMLKVHKWECLMTRGLTIAVKIGRTILNGVD